MPLRAFYVAVTPRKTRPVSATWGNAYEMEWDVTISW